MNGPFSKKEQELFLKKRANPGLFLVYFHHFLTTISTIQIEKSIDGVLGIQTQGRRMVGTDKTTELWRPPMKPLSMFAPLTLVLIYARTE